MSSAFERFPNLRDVDYVIIGIFKGIFVIFAWRETRASLSLSACSSVQMSESTTERKITFFDVSMAGVPAGRVVFQLYNDLVPKTAENFRPFLSLSSTSTTRTRSLITYILSLSHPDRRTLHWRKGHRRVWKAPMVQRQWFPSYHQEVRAALPHE
jgi:hypothetical protein